MKVRYEDWMGAHEVEVDDLAGFVRTYGKDATAVTIPDGVRKLEKNLFRGCGKLTSVVVPNGVRSVGPGCFRGCSALESVVLSASVRYVGAGAFARCGRLRTVDVQSDDVTWGPDAFDGCRSLETDVSGFVPRDQAPGSSRDNGGRSRGSSSPPSDGRDRRADFGPSAPPDVSPSGSPRESVAERRAAVERRVRSAPAPTVTGSADLASLQGRMVEVAASGRESERRRSIGARVAAAAADIGGLEDDGVEYA